MNIQIFGTTKCFDTKKAQRYFKERNIKVQFINLKEKSMSKGELTSVMQAVGGMDKLIDLKAKDQDIAALEAYMLKEIAGKAAKLAAIHHFSIIYSSPAVDVSSISAGWLHNGTVLKKNARVVAGSAQDITDELIRELQ